MTNVSARLSNYRQSPRKVRLLAGLIRGKDVATALVYLKQQPQRAAAPLHKLIRSAVASATNNYGLPEATLKVQGIVVEQAQTFRRSRPAAHGAAHPIRRRGSTVKVTISSPASPKAKAAPEADEKAEAAVA